MLITLKTNFEQAQKFVEDTICRLRYGEAFISSSVNWGTEFYVYTVKELYDKYKQAKDNGAGEAELDAISQQITEVEYRNNPLVMQRMLILKQLEPYPHKTLDQVINLFSKGLLDKQKVLIKLNFSSFIDRFERENINIMAFGTSLTLREKVNTIYQKLLDYAKEEQLTEQADRTSAGEGASGNSEE